MKREKKILIIKITLICIAVFLLAGIGFYFGMIHYLHQSMNYVETENDALEELNVPDIEEKDYEKVQEEAEIQDEAEVQNILLIANDSRKNSDGRYLQKYYD